MWSRTFLNVPPTCPLLARSSTDRLLSSCKPSPKSHRQHVRSFFTRMLELLRSRWTMATYRGDSRCDPVHI